MTRAGAAHERALRLLGDWRAPDAAQERLRQRYVAHLRAHPEGLARSCYPDHLTASTLVLSADGAEVLLTLHAKAGRWFQLGGHVDPGDCDLLDAARREATEESGVAGLRLDPEPVQLSEHAVPFCDPRGGARHLDVRFAALAPAGATHHVTEESLAVAWWPVDALPDPDPDLVELVSLARARLAPYRPLADRAEEPRQETSSPRREPASSPDSPGGGSTSIAADQPSR